jgi:dihydrofolate reductase
MNAPSRIEGYAIVSDNGMIATAKGTMPRALKFDADQQFFERGLNSVDVVVHGRHSRERHRRSDMRRRLILTRRIPSIANDANNRNALFWNPTGATLEEVLAILGAPNGSIGVIGGTDVFGLFLDRYDTFFLTRAPGVQIPGGRGVFPEVPALSPEDVLAKHGLTMASRRLLDAKHGLELMTWSRP